MNIYLLILHLAGAATLLLWAVRMVRTGVERSQEPALRRALRESRGSKVKAAGIGAIIALLLQSSTAVAVLAAGFAGIGIMSVATGLALMLGAYFGSSIVVLVLSVDLTWLVPLLLLAGGGLFFKGTAREQRQFGRILIGIALILISLQMIGEATAPLRGNAELPVIVNYLSGDFVTAFLIGAAFTWLVHSSVASALLIVTLAAQGVMPIELGISLILGANLGGTLAGMGLTGNGTTEARRIAYGQLLFRGLGAVAVLLAYHLLNPDLSWLGSDVARQVINLHLAFNLAVLLVGLPLTDVVATLMERLIKPKLTAEEMANPLAGATSALDQKVVSQPDLALASATRELLRMAEIIERMLAPLMELYETGDREKIRQARQMEDAVDQAQQEIKLYLAQIQFGDDPDEVRRAHDLSSFAINLEYVGDAISKTLLRLAERRRDQKLSFSAEGWRELNELHHRVMANMQLALNVLVSQDRESARKLLSEKEAMGWAERASHGQHLLRLQAGASDSIETSNIHLETLRALKTINSLFASVAYPILRASGDLLDSRLSGKA
ncbi:MAG: sodium-dependent inorganic phosphate (Pi) transporter [Devosia sp.]|uniref:Na/Pi cotransporter family protein n=1 Tax=Devosia sp. TaxID=1871048 RepID=UPI00261D94C2|nr:Na/Pi cotransporter family protein [Devosia sp.]MDB5527534.1 sodium-dependent inorganic phosphate (Pi) transporter [Devosia sp.]